MGDLPWFMWVYIRVTTRTASFVPGCVDDKIWAANLRGLQRVYCSPGWDNPIKLLVNHLMGLNCLKTPLAASACHDVTVTWELLALCEGNQPVKNTGWFPSLRASHVELWCLLCCYLEHAVDQTVELLVIETQWCSCDVSVMWIQPFMCSLLSSWTCCWANRVLVIETPWCSCNIRVIWI